MSFRLVNSISKSNPDISKRAIRWIISEVFNVIKTNVGAGGSLKINNFGTFGSVKRQPRVVTTGFKNNTRYNVPGSTSLKFNASRSQKIVNE